VPGEGSGQRRVADASLGWCSAWHPVLAVRIARGSLGWVSLGGKKETRKGAKDGAGGGRRWEEGEGDGGGESGEEGETNGRPRG